MKKLLLVVTVFLLSSVQAFSQEVTFNDDNVLELKEVVEVEGMTQEGIFLAVQSMLSDWTYNANSQMKIDFSDKNSGVVISKGRLYMGYKKLGLMYGWDVYSDYSLTIKSKDNKYQVIIKVPSMYFYHTQNVANRPTETAKITEMYPQYSYKGQWRIKGAATEYGPKVPEIMRDLLSSVKSKIKSSSVDDDF